jgi:hypothetical protein
MAGLHLVKFRFHHVFLGLKAKLPAAEYKQGTRRFAERGLAK